MMIWPFNRKKKSPARDTYTNRRLASIQRIEALNPIKGKDRIVLASVLGYEVIVKKDEFKVNDLCVYFEVDAMLPVEPWSAFLERYKYRVKTMKMAGHYSQGLAMPLSILTKYTDKPVGLGDDVTSIIGVREYSPRYIPEDGKRGKRRGGIIQRFPFPTNLVPITDEPRLQSYPSILDDAMAASNSLVATLKLDGSSMTVLRFKDEEIVCSRRVNVTQKTKKLKPYHRVWFFWKVPVEINSDIPHWDAFQQLEISGRVPEGYAFQGELVGPGIQKNRLGLDSYRWYVFNVFNIADQRYLDHTDAKNMVESLGLTFVPVIDDDIRLSGDRRHLIEYFALLSQREYKDHGFDNSKAPAEGIVVRPTTGNKGRTEGRRMSFKVINPNFEMIT